LASSRPNGSDSSGGQGTSDSSAGPICRVDLHLHSRYSGVGHLRAPRLRGELAEPADLYRTARARGMDLVTLTDVDTLDGCLRFLDAHPGATDFFVSEEVLAVEPVTGAAVGVLLFDIDEAQHRAARRLKGDIRDVAAYVRSEGILASLGSLLGVLEAGGSDQLLRDLIVLFDRHEIRNGAEGRACNDLMARLAQEVAAGRSLGVTAGSNAHIASRAGRTATLARGRGREEFLGALRRNQTWVTGDHGRVWGALAEVVTSVPLHRAAAPLLDRCLSRARRTARARSTRKRLDQVVVQKFQEKARSYEPSVRRARQRTDSAR